MVSAGESTAKDVKCCPGRLHYGRRRGADCRVARQWAVGRDAAKNQRRRGEDPGLTGSWGRLGEPAERCDRWRVTGIGVRQAARY